MNQVLEKLIDQVNSGFEPLISFSGEKYQILEFKDFGLDKFVKIRKLGEIKELMINIKNRELKLNS